MKNIVLLQDGTWNDEKGLGLTNIVKTSVALNSLLKEENSDEIKKKQVHIYNEGVGTQGGCLQRAFDGLTGRGLIEDVKKLYSDLVAVYEPGDKIFLLGFSRGATTVRAISGMIRDVGILKPEHKERVDEAFSLFIRYDIPDDSDVVTFRQAYSYFDEVRIRFLGVFDTVAAIGVPLTEKDDEFFVGNLDYKALNNKIDIARHALAVDEHRRSFAPTLWTARPDVDSEQRWFPGAHSDVGGGYQHHGLSDCAQVWMMREAQAAGLILPASFFPDQEHYDAYQSDDEKSEFEDALSDPEKNIMRRRQLRLRPNSLGKLHESRKRIMRWGDKFVYGKFFREVGKTSQDESLDPSLLRRMEDENRFPPYAPFEFHYSKDVARRFKEWKSSLHQQADSVSLPLSGMGKPVKPTGPVSKRTRLSTTFPKPYPSKY